MKFNKFAYLPLLFVAVIAHWGNVVQGESSVWTVSKGDKYLYIGGTVHVLSAIDFPLPVEFDEAYALSDMLVFETDIAAMANPENQKKLMLHLSYADGTTLEDHVSAEIYDEVAQFFEDREVPIGQISTFQPGLVMSIMSMVELRRLGMANAGIDQLMSNKAAADGKYIDQLETIDQQISFLGAIGQENPDRLLRYTLRDLQDMGGIMAELKNLWRVGDMDGIANVHLAEMRASFPRVYDTLLDKRNRAWLPKIERMMETSAIEFILVGAAHLAGTGSVLELLEENGYRVVPL